MPLYARVTIDDVKVQLSMKPFNQTINHDNTSLGINSKQDPIADNLSQIAETSQQDLPTSKENTPTITPMQYKYSTLSQDTQP